MDYNAIYDWLTGGAHETECEVVACIIKGLEPSQEHTFYNPDGARALLMSKATKQVTFQNQTFSRIAKGVVRVEADVMNFFDCNYLFIYNKPFATTSADDIVIGAFITNIEWVSVYVADIHFKIDPIQSFLFKYAPLGKCFVEREQPPINEQAGDFLLSEPINDITTITTGITKSGYFNNYDIVAISSIQQSTSPDLEDIFLGVTNGITYVGDLQVYDNIAQFQQIITAFAQKAGALETLYAAYFYPEDFAINQAQPVEKFVDVTKMQTVDGHPPKYKKLLTFPFTYLLVDTLETHAVYRQEYFNGTNMRFKLTGVMCAQPQIICEPMGYSDMDNSAYVTMSNFPHVLWCGNAFENWLGQNGTNVAIMAGLDVAGIVGGIATANPLMVSAAGTHAATTIGQLSIAYHKPSTVNYVGTPNQALVATRKKDFYFINKQVNRESAETIDNFFDVYGYSIMKTKTPECNPANTKGTTHCYVKLGNVSYKGDPAGGLAPYLAEITQILQKGITFWDMGSEIGTY